MKSDKINFTVAPESTPRKKFVSKKSSHYFSFRLTFSQFIPVFSTATSKYITEQKKEDETKRRVMYRERGKFCRIYKKKNFFFSKLFNETEKSESELYEATLSRFGSRAF